MRRGELGDLAAFLAVAEERSFTRAAARLGTSQSALSHTVRRLETRLGLRLLTRNTRSVAPTDAGERLLETLRPAFDDIDGRLAALVELRDKPAGTIRITTGQHAADRILWPALLRLLPEYPDVRIELSIDQALTDIVSERFDAGVRLGEQIAKGMIAVRIGPDMRMAVVASPAYFATRTKPRTPQDLTPTRASTCACQRSAASTPGVRERRPAAECTGRWPVDFQRRGTGAESGDRRLRLGVRHGRPGQN